MRKTNLIISKNLNFSTLICALFSLVPSKKAPFTGSSAAMAGEIPIKGAIFDSYDFLRRLLHTAGVRAESV